jgi:hypothetical protein
MISTNLFSILLIFSDGSDGSDGTAHLVLCYKFATEPFALYTNIALAVHVPMITTVSATLVVKVTKYYFVVFFFL